MESQPPPPPDRPIHCRVCTILMGSDYEEKHPIPLPNRQGFVCGRCYESLRRQLLRRAETSEGGR